MRWKVSLLALTIGILGGLLWFQTDYQKQILHPDVDGPYQSICSITSGDMIASGVLLESGMVLTSAHAIDRDLDGEVTEKEKQVTVTFHLQGGNFVTTGTTLVASHVNGYEAVDLAILKLGKTPPIRGVSLITTEEYSKLTIGTPNFVIGMTNGEVPAHVTDGRITAFDSPANHRSSATVYLGNSGGGVFLHNKKLIGIAGKTGVDKAFFAVPLFDDGQLLGSIKVSYARYLSNIGRYLPAPEIRKFIEQHGLTGQALPPSSFQVPKQFFYYILINIINLMMLFGVFKFVSMKERQT
ncbi:MAG: S1 family peptidase [Candidatus Sifarchaeia archaeon]|jgi:V8-like Glu-specific endopeptidase